MQVRNEYGELLAKQGALYSGGHDIYWTVVLAARIRCSHLRKGIP
jgi:hypothetical protein